MKIRTYTELMRLPTFEERYEYLRMGSKVGAQTFGVERYLNQTFYRSDWWRLEIRPAVIARDYGCDLGDPSHKITNEPIIVHHMNSITMDDIINRTPYLYDLEYLISPIKSTHNAIHYGDESQLLTLPSERRPNDTCPWKQQ